MANSSQAPVARADASRSLIVQNVRVESMIVVTLSLMKAAKTPLRLTLILRLKMLKYQPTPALELEPKNLQLNGQALELKNDGKEILSEKTDGKHQSPNWEVLGEESDKEAQDITTIVTEEECEEEDVAGDDELIQEEKITRQSQRIKEQGMGAIKIAEKAALAVKKKNLEGNYSNPQNSFAVLSNDEITDRSRKMGVRIEDNIPEKCDMLRELEKARVNMSEKDTQKKKDQDK
jgi:hypothetical protein